MSPSACGTAATFMNILGNGTAPPIAAERCRFATLCILPITIGGILGAIMASSTVQVCSGLGGDSSGITRMLISSESPELGSRVRHLSSPPSLLIEMITAPLSVPAGRMFHSLSCPSPTTALSLNWVREFESPCIILAVPGGAAMFAVIWDSCGERGNIR
ncbi:hypothetical protein DFP73DRAFT_565544 [Morchella snyderi]|nr:hypothetical protein DFP73DRAFT_565544 [Morchella snyderi]